MFAVEKTDNQPHAGILVAQDATSLALAQIQEDTAAVLQAAPRIRLIDIEIAYSHAGIREAAIDRPAYHGASDWISPRDMFDNTAFCARAYRLEDLAPTGMAVIAAALNRARLSFPVFGFVSSLLITSAGTYWVPASLKGNLELPGRAWLSLYRPWRLFAQAPSAHERLAAGDEALAFTHEMARLFPEPRPASRRTG